MEIYRGCSITVTSLGYAAHVRGETFNVDDISTAKGIIDELLDEELPTLSKQARDLLEAAGVSLSLNGHHTRSAVARALKGAADCIAA